MAFYKSGTATNSYGANSLALTGAQTNSNGPTYMPVVRPGQPNSSVGDYGSGGSLAPLDGVAYGSIAAGGIVGPALIDLPVHVADLPLYGASGYVRIYNDGAVPLSYSTDGTTEAGKVQPYSVVSVSGTPPANISVKGSTKYRIEAWFPS